ncbi:MAG: sugar ABC transporter substrate-binding protein [Firmicutes bacterium]|nr:sugar ABC transporter substrate-binding protein [Bacillota bacterium]
MLKKQMFPVVSIFLSAVVLALLLVGQICAASPKLTLKFWKFAASNDDGDLAKMVDQWNKENPDIKVVFETFPWDQYVNEKLTVGFASRQGPDVFWISPGEFMKYVENGIALPLNQYFPEDLKQDLVPAALDAVTVKGKIYAVPHEMEPVALYYNKNLFKQSGVEPPTTWDELISTAKKLKTSNRWGVMIPTAGDYYQNFVFYPFLWMAGGDVLDKEWTQCTFNSPATAKALDFWGDLINKYKVAPPTGGNPGDESLANGLTSMFVVGYWYAGILKNNYPKFEYGVVPIPKPTNGKFVTVYGGWTTMVSSQSKHPKEAAEFAVWLFGKDPGRPLIWIEAPRTKLSPRLSVMEKAKDYFDKFPHNVFRDQILKIARAEPAYPPEIAKAVTDAIQEVLFKGKSGAQAAEKASKTIEAYLKRIK